MNKSAKLAVIIAVSVAVVVGLIVGAVKIFGGSGNPPTAQQQVMNDGMTVDGSAAYNPNTQLISSIAWGDNGNGNAEIVLVLTPQGQSQEQKVVDILSSTDLGIGSVHTAGSRVVVMTGPFDFIQGYASGL